MKNDLTVEIENALINKFKNTGIRFATEVGIMNPNAPNKHVGIVDFITAQRKFENGFMKITAYEIKVSFSDFKSKHGHNLTADSNYYVIPLNLFKEIMEKDKNLLSDTRIGIYAYSKGRLYHRRSAKENMLNMSLRERFYVLDEMLMYGLRRHQNKTAFKRYTMLFKFSTDENGLIITEESDYEYQIFENNLEYNESKINGTLLHHTDMEKIKVKELVYFEERYKENSTTLIFVDNLIGTKINGEIFISKDYSC